MICRISEDIALRSWKGVPRAYYKKGSPLAKRLSVDEFEILKSCDGEQDLPDDPALRRLLERGLAVVCQKGDRPLEWSRLRVYENRHFPHLNLMITGKCNYNCLHCFNAADNAPLMSEWAYEDLCRLIHEARDCGIHCFTLTGGEPMLHPGFVDILREIVACGMYVEEVNTNGSLITQELLDRIKETGCCPRFKISFDGIGSHDWMRARKGAEENTLAAISLCVKKGFPVRIQTQVNEKTYGTLLQTADLMERLGVEGMRLIRTTETDRWLMNAKEATIPFSRYYERMLAFAVEFARGERRMDIDIWQFLKLYPHRKAYRASPVMCGDGEYRWSMPACSGIRSSIAVTAEGEIVPCMQMGGYLKSRRIHMGNVHADSLKNLLTSGRYHDVVMRTVEEVRSDNSKCASCPWFRYCCGGCRALGLLFSGERLDLSGEDISKCLFFEGGWYERIAEALPGWTSIKKL